MDWGMANRLARVIPPDGRCYYLAIDHGYFQGPTTSLERPGETLAPLIPHIDALFVTRGVLRNCVPESLPKPVILRVSGGSSMVGKDLAHEAVTTSIEEAVRLNAAAVGLSVFVGSDYEHETIVNLSDLVNEAEPLGIPVMAVTAVGREMEKRDARYLALASRICAEQGARVVKTYWCEEGFEKVVQGCPVPVVIAGGPKCDTELEVLEFVWDGIQKGAIGVNLGRNVWQHPHPVPMIKALNAVVHGNASPKDALAVFHDAKTAETPARGGTPRERSKVGV
jgi:3-hydroxy-5-phosphonooxypentane-2,4-dione thiolase